MIASVSGNAIYRLRFRIFTLNCCMSFTLVHWRPSLSAAIVTQLVTHTAFFSGMLSGGLSLIPQPLSIGGWPVIRDFFQSVSNLFLGGRPGAAQSGRLVPYAVTNPARHRVRRWRIEPLSILPMLRGSAVRGWPWRAVRHARGSSAASARCARF